MLAALAPAALFPTPRRFAALLLIPLLWLARSFLARRVQRSTFNVQRSSRTPLDYTLLLLALMVLVSLWATYDIAFSLPKIAGMVYGLGVFSAVAAAAGSSPRWFGGLLAVFLALGSGVAALGLIGSRWTAKFPLLAALTARLPAALRGLPGAESGFQPNEVAGVLLWVAPLALTLTVYSGFRMLGSGLRKRPSRSIAKHPRGTLARILAGVGTALAAVLITGVLILTQSRGGLIGFGLALLVMTFVAGFRARWLWAVLALAIAGIVGAFFYVGPARVMELATGAGLATEQTFSETNLAGRVEVWSRAIYGLQDFPFTGMGMNTFRKVVNVLYPLFTISPDSDIAHAHNEFLQAGLDLGLPGLIAFLALYLGAFWMLYRVARSTFNVPPSGDFATFNVPPSGDFATFNVPPSGDFATFNAQRAAALGLGGGLFAHLVYGLTDAVALGARPGFVFWMLLGLIAGLHRQVAIPTPDGPSLPAMYNAASSTQPPATPPTR